MKSFIGTYINKIDAKGRISVPAPFRMVVQAKGLAGVALYPSMYDPCIEGCGLDRIESIAESLPDDPMPGFKQDSISHLIIGMAREAPFDGGGRIVLPEDFMAKAALKDKGAFVGKGRSFQIWEPEALAAAHEAMTRKLAAARRAELEGASQ